jgi:hypothetical protein
MDALRFMQFKSMFISINIYLGQTIVIRMQAMNDLIVEAMPGFIGKTISRIETINYGGKGRQVERVDFFMNDGKKRSMFHPQQCCETVGLEDICGDLDDLLHTPIIIAEKRSNIHLANDGFVFYEFATIKGSVTMRWYGSHSGYYGIDVIIEEVLED